jgi:hypothetical protein
VVVVHGVSAPSPAMEIFPMVAAVQMGVISSSRAMYMQCCKLPNTTVRLLMWFPYEHFNTCGVGHTHEDLSM